MLPKHLRKYFWDTDAEKVNVEKDSQYIIARLLEYGDIPEGKIVSLDKEYMNMRRAHWIY